MSNLDTLTNEIEQMFMQEGGWKACRYLLGKLVADKDAEIERLEAIVAKLPKTADEVSILPGMVVWVSLICGHAAPFRVDGIEKRMLRSYDSGEIKSLLYYDTDKFYSTRETAEVAREQPE